MEYTTPSGAKLLVTIASFQTGKELTLAVAKAVRQGGISSKLPDNFAQFFKMKSATDLMSIDFKDLGGFADIILDVMTSPEVEAAIFKCLNSCNYNNERISSPAFFDPEERRGDFFYIAYTVGRDNIAPFFSLLLSQLRGTSQQQDQDQG